jgi:PAS domain S-box-containing protein
MSSPGIRSEKIETQALQDAILNSAYFSSIATDEKGVIQIFNVGAERMLGYAASDVIDQITPADISDPKEPIARAAELSAELRTPIAPGFEALVFKASRGIEDIYELTYTRKDGSHFPPIVSVTEFQGYFFSRPLPPEDIAALFRGDALRFGNERMVEVAAIATLDCPDVGQRAPAPEDVATVR